MYVDYLHDMLAFAEKGEQFVAGVEFAEFSRAEEKVFAVIRALEVIGEAARHVPVALRRRYPDIPWTKIVGMRNIVIHGYFGVDYEVIWRTAREDLPPLRVAVARALAELEASPSP